jgi:hypothetical protein
MALNPFFLQGSESEQRLVQDLINEQLQIFGVEVMYLPRKIVSKDNIFTEIESSKFDNTFAIEAYVNTYEGYTGAGDVMTKFGMSLKDELTVTISKERFEDFISPFLEGLPDSEVEVTSRPREGDLIYFPLGQRLFEIKFVEHEKPFYQLGKTYVYELQCELFELEDEVGGWDQLSTTTEAIDDVLVEQGYVTSLKLISIGSTATVSVSTATGYIRNIVLNNDGYDYIKEPTVAISTAPVGGTNASAVAITTSVNGIYSVKEILLTNAGAGYTIAPTVSIISASSGETSYGVGAAATATLVKDSAGIRNVSIASSGSGYPTNTNIIFQSPSSGVGTAIGRAIVNTSGFVTSILMVDSGIGYDNTTAFATVTTPPTISGIGTYTFNEIVTGSKSGAKGRVKSWDSVSNVLKLGATSGTFIAGDVAIGSTSEGTSFTPIIVNRTGDMLAYASTITGINTTGISIGQEVQNVGVLTALTNVTGITTNEVGDTLYVTVYLSKSGINTESVLEGKFEFGTRSTAPVAQYTVDYIESAEYADKYDKGDEIETEADKILDFTESNPFGTY